MSITLSGRQIHAADRIGGIELMLPWPTDLRHPDDLDADEDRPATPREYAAAMALVAAACEDHDLVPCRVSAARCARHDGDPPSYWLAVVIIGRRWVHATDAPEARTIWYRAHRLPACP